MKILKKVLEKGSLILMMMTGSRQIAYNVSAMSSGGFGTTHYQNKTNDNRKHKR